MPQQLSPLGLLAAPAPPVARPPRVGDTYFDTTLGISRSYDGGGWTSVPPRSYRHEQTEPASVWVVQHGLGFDPGGVMVHDASGQMVGLPWVEHLVPGSTVRIAFEQPLAGVATLS